MKTAQKPIHLCEDSKAQQKKTLVWNVPAICFALSTLSPNYSNRFLTEVQLLTFVAHGNKIGSCINMYWEKERLTVGTFNHDRGEHGHQGRLWRDRNQAGLFQPPTCEGRIGLGLNVTVSPSTNEVGLHKPPLFQFYNYKDKRELCTL